MWLYFTMSSPGDGIKSLMQNCMHMIPVMAQPTRADVPEDTIEFAMIIIIIFNND